MKISNTMQGTIALVAVAGMLAATPASAQRTARQSIEGLEKLEKVDLQLMVLSRYRATGESALTKDQVLAHAEDLVYSTGSDVNLVDPRVQGERYSFAGREDPSAALDIDTSTGDISFCSGLARYSRDGSTPGLPGPEIAPKIALDQIAGLGLLPDEREMFVAHVGGLNMSARDERGATADYEKLVTVHFGRVLDGLPVHGASRLVVHLAEDGRLQGLVRRWAAVQGERIGAGDVLDRGAVLDAALAALGETSADAVSIVVDSAQVVLYDDGQGIIEPAVRVTATRRYADKRLGEQPLDFYIPAMWKASGEFPSIGSRHAPEK